MSGSVGIYAAMRSHHFRMFCSHFQHPPCRYISSKHRWNVWVRLSRCHKSDLESNVWLYHCTAYAFPGFVSQYRLALNAIKKSRIPSLIFLTHKQTHIHNTHCLDLVNIFSTFLPQLLLYPNPSDPLNGQAAALMMKNPDAYSQRIRGDHKKTIYTSCSLKHTAYRSAPREVLDLSCNAHHLC